MSSQTSLHGPPGVAIKPEILEAPGPFIVDLGSPASSSESTVIYKVSNSDDEDMVAQARADRRELSTSTRSATRLSTVLPRASDRAFQNSDRSSTTSSGPLAANFALWPSTASRPNAVPFYRSPYMVVEQEQRRTHAFVEVAPRAALSGHPRSQAQMRGEAVPRSQSLSMRSPDLPSTCFGLASHAAQSRAESPPRHSSVRRQFMSQLSVQKEFFPMSPNEVLLNSRYTPKPPSQALPVLPLTDLVSTQPERRPPTLPVIESTLSYAVAKENRRSSSNIEITSDPWAPKGVEARTYTQILPITSKHAATPPRKDARKRIKNHSGFGPDDIPLPYNTIKVIKMPARNDMTPGQDAPEPTPENLPYGDTEDYRSCMLIYWLDEQELTYREGIELLRQRFPEETANYETIRKRHLSALQRLARKYGLKPDSEIEKPGDKVQRRGRQAGVKYSTIGGRVLVPTATHAAAITPAETAAARPALWSQPQTRGRPVEPVCVRVGQPLATRGLLLACIVVWKDIEGATFDQIQRRLADDFDWKLGYKTVQKLYYEERPRVYDVRLNARDDSHMEDNAGSVDAIRAEQGTIGDDARADVARASSVRYRSL